VARRQRDAAVYSSDRGRLCPHCGRAIDRCACRANPRGGATLSNADGDGIVRVGRSSRGRGGKTVTLVTGVQLEPDALARLARDLKRTCGTGGALKGGTIEIQGDQRDAVQAALEQRGFTVKRTGG
jgi:translation initiation factor 1